MGSFCITGSSEETKQAQKQQDFAEKIKELREKKQDLSERLGKSKEKSTEPTYLENILKLASMDYKV